MRDATEKRGVLLGEILRLTRLRKKFRNGRGVDDISLTIEEGDIFGLLGVNGAGKTTTMKIIAGLMKKDSGSEEVFGTPLEEALEESMSKIGALIETPNFYGYMTAAQNMSVASRYYSRRDASRAGEILSLVGLAEYQGDRTSRFSLGMKQRLGLALAMVGDPKLYILDEPSNGLDIGGIIEIRGIILGMAEERRASFLISSHQAAEIQKLCNKVGVIHKGRVCGAASMDDILSSFPSVEDYYLYCVGGGEPLNGNGGARAYEGGANICD
jgi:ABC-2 type transport system ATP-binding protein